MYEIFITTRFEEFHESGAADHIQATSACQAAGCFTDSEWFFHIVSWGTQEQWADGLLGRVQTPPGQRRRLQQRGPGREKEKERERGVMMVTE